MAHINMGIVYTLQEDHEAAKVNHQYFNTLSIVTMNVMAFIIICTVKHCYYYCY